MIEILQTSPLHSIQDQGRFGFSGIGIGNAGAWDMRAHQWAQWCLGQAGHQPSIELIAGGFRARFLADGWFSLTGADCHGRLDDQPLLPWRAHAVNAGQTLTLGTPCTGRVAYLGLQADFSALRWLDSASYSRRDGLGQPLTRGLCLPVSMHAVTPRDVPRQFIPSYQGDLELSVIPHARWPEAADQQGYQVTALSDRMGTRLSGEQPLSVKAPEFSAPIPLGAIQVPPDGHPIVLNRDRQSMGGYPVIGCATRLSLGDLAQSAPGRTVYLQTVSPAQARAKLGQLADFFGEFP